ncbi:MAG: CHAT domain-containing protein [Acidobacteria bacterium]|nr:CHAT domain-containing protein [Acidobacteriota bacterium]
MTSVLEFHLQSDTSDIFNVTVYAPDAAQPLASARFEYRLDDLAQVEISRLDFNPRDPLGRLERLQAFGQKLYQKLFPAEIERLWQAQRERADLLTLRVRIHADAKRLEAVPWEALHDGTEFLAAGAKTTLTRLPLGIDPITDLPAIPLPIRMLALVSSPPDLPDVSRLNIEREQELLLEAINAPAGQGKLHVDFEDEAKLEILESSLEAGYHILHFTGHGIAPEQGGGLLLEDHDGKRLPVGVNDFVASLAKGFGTLRLAVISGCNTAQTLHTGGFRDLARALVEKKIPAVLAMQFAISDGGGLKLAEVLYPKLSAGQVLEAATHAARRALWLSEDAVLQADALALVLLTGNGGCLQAKAADAPTVNFNPTIDTGFQLGTLPQLGFKFYGRRKEYRQLRDDLLVKNHRAVIIHGIGGIGKTSLIAHAADRLYHRRRQDGPRFKGIYAFDCAGATLAPERVLLELHRYFALQDISVLERFVGQPLEPEVLAQMVAQVLAQWPLLLIFDNFETQLARTEAGFRIADEGLRRFLAALVKATVTNTKFVFTCRFLFELDERLSDVASLPLGDLSRPEAFSVMLKLPRLAKVAYAEKEAIYHTFGGHPFALVALDKCCQTSSVANALQNAKAVHTKLREHLALELNYGSLTEPARTLLNRLAAFRVAVPLEAAEWVMGETVTLSPEALQPMIAMLRQDENFPAELKDADDATLLQMLTEMLPVQRQAPDDLQQSVRELIEWGLLTPVYESDELSRLDVHSLVRAFCREKQAGTWRNRLREATGFYTNLTKRIPDEQKTPALVWSGMEAFELLMEAEDYRDASQLLLGAHELLDRWGFGRYVESQYARVLDRVERADAAVLMHNFGMLQQNRGNYEAALDYYQCSLKVLEEIGNVAGVAESQGQIGRLLTETGRCAEAFGWLLNALGAFSKLQSPNTGIVVNMLKSLRGKWDGFAAAWREATGEDVPEWLQ